MKHLKRGRKFHRKKDQRRAFLKSLVSNLILRGRIETTEARAKEASREIEKLITLAKKNNLAAFRSLLSFLPEKSAKRLYYEIAPRFLERKGGYTRIIKTTKHRKRDGVRVAILELL